MELFVPRGLGVPVAKLPAPDMVRRFKPVNPAAGCRSVLGKKRGPPSEAQCHQQGVTSR